jgi:hypothetical protein
MAGGTGGADGHNIIAAGTQTANTTGTIIFSNSNGITFGMSNSSIVTASHNGLTTARASNDGVGLNTAQTNVTWTVNSAGISINAGGYAGTGTSATNASVTLNSNGIQISVAAPGGGGSPASFFDNLNNYAIGTTTQSIIGSTAVIQPFQMPYDISASYIRNMITMSVGNTTSIATTNGATGSCSILSTIWNVVYKQNTGASSLSLSSIASGSVGFTQRWSLSANATAGSVWTLSQSVSFSGTMGASQYTTQIATSLTNYSLGSLSLTLFTGMKALDIPFNTSLAASNYWMLFGGSSTTSTGGAGLGAMTNLRISFSNIAVTQANISMGHFGNNTNASIQYGAGLGSVSTNAINTTASLGLSNISSSASHVKNWFQLIRQS